MKKPIIISSFLLLTVSLVGCNTLHNVGAFGANTVGAGVNVVTGTGAFLGRGLDRGVGFVTGRDGLIYRHGHYYKVKHGRYVYVR